MGRNEEATLLLRIKSIGSEAISTTISSLKELGKIAATAFVALGGALAYSIKQYGEEEKAVNALNQAMVQNGIYTKALSDDYRKQAAELQKLTTFGDEQIIAAQAVLQQKLGDIKITKELTMATLNLAAATGGDLTGAAEKVGKSIGSSTNALARNGIEIDTNASKTDKLAQVTSKLNDMYGGQAEAQAKGLGAILQAQNALSDFAETIGKIASPYVKIFTDKIVAMSEKLQSNDGFLRMASTTIEYFVKALLFGKNVIELVSGMIGTHFGFMASMVENFVNNGLSGFSKAGDIMGIMMEEQKANVIGFKTSMEEDFALVDATTKQATVDRESEHMAKVSAMRKVAIDAEKKEKIEMGYFKKLQQQAEIKDMEGFFNLAKGLQSAKSKELAAIGKAFALTEIAIKTPMAISSSFAFGTSLGGPPLGFAMGAIAAAAMAAQAAQVLGVPLAEGGVVMPRPGGTLATIGEGGQAEAVIPLDKAGGMGFGGGMTIHFHGPVLGDESQARRFAEVLDRELYNMRKSNSSLSFEGII